VDCSVQAPVTALCESVSDLPAGQLRQHTL
jgi:hypothetical protein